MAVSIPDNLKLDMARIFDILFDINIRTSEIGLGLALGNRKGAHQRHIVVADPHPLAASAGCGLDNHRIFDRLGYLDSLLFAFDDTLGPGGEGNADFAHSLAGCSLIPHGSDGLRGGPNKGDIARFADFGEMGILGEETVAGMNRINVGDLGRRDNGWDIQITFRAGGRPDTDGLIGKPHMEGISVGFGIHSHRWYIHLPARPYN